MTKEDRREYDKQYSKQYREENKEKIKEWRENNKEKIKENYKIHYEKYKQKKKQYRENNKEYYKEYQKQYNENNKEKRSIYYKNKRQTDPLFKLSCNLRTRIGMALKNKNYIKSKCTLDMLDCDLHTAKAHLEKQFTKGMTWDNHGEWHIDHIIPCASAKTEKELIKLFHYTNLQPLWAVDNMSKRDKIIEKQLFLI
jgi:hypothetical protein